MDVHCLKLAREGPSAWFLVTVMCATTQLDIALAPVGDGDRARAEHMGSLPITIEGKGLLCDG